MLFIVLGRWFSITMGAFFVVFGGFCTYFFRDPEPDETVLSQEGVIVSPADGKILEIGPVNGEGYGPGQVIRIFLSVFDAHTQRAPVSGQVRSVVYQPGMFLDARDHRAPFVNEQNSILIDSPVGLVMVKQLAGLIARRIVCWVRSGHDVQAGDLIGLIRFGSQVDLYLPAGVVIKVKEGSRVYCAKTIVAESKASATRPSPLPSQGITAKN
jgi:phosphatidylserine decarboxylase